MNRLRRPANCLLAFISLSLSALGQSDTPATAQTRRYSIEVAGLRVGTLTAVRQPMPDGPTVYTLISDVKANLLVYKVLIYYKTTTLFERGQVKLATVEARTNRGNYLSRTEWKKDHYEITADQYKYTKQATEPLPIDYTVSNLFFGEPIGQNRAYAEYFGDYFTLTPAGGGVYRARRDGREDEYHYKNGQLTTIVKQNALKNFVIRLLPESQPVASN